MKSMPSILLHPIKRGPHLPGLGAPWGKIRAVMSQGVTSGFGYLPGKDLPPSPTLLLVGTPPGLCLWRAPGCSDRGPAPPCPPWPLPPDQFSPARATLHHPHPSQNQRQSRPTWNPTFVASTRTSSCVHPFPPRCEALEVTVMNGLRASEFPQPGRPGILWPASRAAAQ